MTIGIYGGTFDPPHIGHIQACKNFLNSFMVDKMYIIPTSIPPHKIRNSIVDGATRFEMCKIAFENIASNIEISDVELNRQGKSYTADTIKHFRELGNDIIYFLCGTDMFLTLDKWYKPEYILSNAIIVCMRRESDAQNTLAIKEKELEYIKKFNAKIYFLNDDAIELSSSEIRDNIEDESVKELLSPDVLAFISKNGLYRKE